MATLVAMSLVAVTSSISQAGPAPVRTTAQAKAWLASTAVVRIAPVGPSSDRAKQVPVSTAATARMSARGTLYHVSCFEPRGTYGGYDALGDVIWTLSTAIYYCSGTNSEYCPCIDYIFTNWNGLQVTQNSTHSTTTEGSLFGWRYVSWDDVGNVDPEWVPTNPVHQEIYFSRQAHWSHCSLGVPILCNDAYPYIKLWVHWDGYYSYSYGYGT